MAADPAPPPDGGEPTIPAADLLVPAEGLLGELAALGPYFAVEVHPHGSPLCPPWHSLGELTETLTSPDALAARISDVRERLAATAGCAAADVEFRVAASVAQLGMCARLLSPVLGAAAAGWALPVDTAQAWWIPALGGPFRLSLPEPATPEMVLPESAAPGSAAPGSATPELAPSEPPSPAPAAPEAACLSLLTSPIGQIVRAVEAMAVSPQVLWGNVASAVNGAATMIAKARPGLAAPAASAATAMLRYPALTGTHRGSPGAGFRRRNCCLIYRLSPPGTARYCGDCVLDPV